MNLASGWLGIVLISPGLFGVDSVEKYLKLLLVNVPFGIVGLLAAFWLTEKGRKGEK